MEEYDFTNLVGVLSSTLFPIYILFTRHTPNSSFQNKHLFKTPTTSRTVNRLTSPYCTSTIIPVYCTVSLGARQKTVLHQELVAAYRTGHAN